MNELEKAVRVYVDSHPNNKMNYPEWDGADAYDAFVAGAQWQAKQSTWISVEERLPEDNQLVLTSSSIYGTKLLVWNDHYKVWDDEDGDDVYCERDKIDAWMSPSSL